VYVKKHNYGLNKKIMPNQHWLHVQQLPGYEEINSMAHWKVNVNMKCNHYSLLWCKKNYSVPWNIDSPWYDMVEKGPGHSNTCLPNLVSPWRNLLLYISY